MLEADSHFFGAQYFILSNAMVERATLSTNGAQEIVLFAMVWALNQSV